MKTNHTRKPPAVKWLAPLSLVVAIAGCANQPGSGDPAAMQPQKTQPAQPAADKAAAEPAKAEASAAAPGGLALFADADARLASLVERIYQDPTAVPYREFWTAYLASSKIHTAVADRTRFSEAMAQLSGNERCGAVDWEKWTARNFVQLEPHLSAQDCYRQLGNREKAERQARAVQYILRGVLGSGDGQWQDTAYEIGILDQATDILRLAGYRLLDSWLVPARGGMGLYYGVLAEDSETGKQRTIWFDNQRAVHRILDITFPFAGLDNLYITRLLEPLSESSTAAMNGLARYHQLQGNREQAVSLYLTAAAHGSQIADYQLGRLCLVNEDLPTFSRGDCVDFLLSAAEKGNAEAMSLLAYVYREGIGVEASEALAKQFLQAARERLQPGQADLDFSRYYAGDRLVVDAQVEEKYLRKAAAEGSQDAQLEVLERQHGNPWQAEAEKILPALQKLAEQGDTSAQLIYAGRVFANPAAYTEAELVWARKFLDAALAVNSRTAHAMQGKLLMSGLLGQRDFARAKKHFMRSPLMVASQMGMAKLHNQQRLPDTDPRLAAAWYMMCARAEVPECLYQLGRLFNEGEGVERNPSIAVTLLAEAARQGHSGAAAEIKAMEPVSSADGKD